MLESKYKILVTLGPRSIEKNIIEQMEKEQVYLFRINLSHTKIEELEDVVNKIRSHTQIPICLDSRRIDFTVSLVTAPLSLAMP